MLFRTPKIVGLEGAEYTPFLPSAFFCGFRAVRVMPAPYPTGIARGFGPFVDLLLTRAEQCKEPPLGAAINLLRLLYKTGCGGRI